MANFRLKWHLARSNRRIFTQSRSQWYIGTMSYHSFVGSIFVVHVGAVGGGRMGRSRSDRSWPKSVTVKWRAQSSALHHKRSKSIKTTHLRQWLWQCSVHAYTTNDVSVDSLWPIYTTEIDVWSLEIILRGRNSIWNLGTENGFFYVSLPSRSIWSTHERSNASKLSSNDV